MNGTYTADAVDCGATDTQKCTCITCTGKWPSNSIIPVSERDALLQKVIQSFSEQAEQSPHAASKTSTHGRREKN